MTASRPAALIVEDQPFVGLVASDILKESGFETFHAYDASGAVELLAQHPEIEVVLTEAELPGPVDGLELAAGGEGPAAGPAGADRGGRRGRGIGHADRRPAAAQALCQR